MIGIGRGAGSDDTSRITALIDDHHFDRVQIVGGETMLTAEKAECAARHVAAHANVGTLAGREHDAPAEEEPPVHLAERGARLHGEGAHVGIVVDAPS